MANKRERLGTYFKNKLSETIPRIHESKSHITIKLNAINIIKSNNWKIFLDNSLLVMGILDLQIVICTVT